MRVNKLKISLLSINKAFPKLHGEVGFEIHATSVCYIFEALLQTDSARLLAAVKGAVIAYTTNPLYPRRRQRRLGLGELEATPQ